MYANRITDTIEKCIVTQKRKFEVKSKKGFTLIELLVVIAIIALLLSIIMPAINKVKDAAVQTVCLSNQRQLTVSVQGYIADNDDLLPRAITGYRNEANGPFSNTTPNPNGSWVCNPMKNTTGGSTDDYFSSTDAYTATLEQKLNGIRNGFLFPYHESIDVLHCQMDKRNRKVGGGFRTYSLTHMMHGWEGTVGLSKWGPVAKKSGQIRSPVTRLMIVEEADARGINLGAWVMPIYGGTWGMSDSLAYWHKGGCSLAFADGHAEIYRFKEKETTDYLKFLEAEAAMLAPGEKGKHFVQAMDANNKDVIYLVQRWKNFK